MDHAAQSDAMDDRPLRILERTPVPDEHKQRLFDLVRAAQDAARDAGTELQSEFGKEHVSLIVGCNQFLRLYRGGDHAGQIELLLPDWSGLEAAGFQPSDAVGGQIFKMFGWRTVDPMQGDGAALDAAVHAAFGKAAGAGKPNGP